MDAKLKTKHYFLCINFLCLSYSVIVDFLQLFFTSIRVAGTPTARLDDWHFAPDKLELKLNLLGDTQPRQFSLKNQIRLLLICLILNWVVLLINKNFLELSKACVSLNLMQISLMLF